MSVSANASAIAIQVFASTLVMFLLYKISLQTLGPTDLGVWAVVLGTASASRIAELGLATSATKYVAAPLALNDIQAAGIVVQTAFISVVVLSIVLLPLLYIALNGLFWYIFRESELAKAAALIPYLLGTFPVTAGAASLQSGIDGCQKYQSRAVIVVSSQILLLAATYIFIKSYGLVGMAIAQLIQGVFLIIVCWVMLKRFLPKLPFVPYQWSYTHFRSMLSYGANFQLGVFAVIFFEPLTKVLLARYSGLDSVAYYEMASQVFSKIRQLLASINQVMIPEYAKLTANRDVGLVAIYSNNLKIQLPSVVVIFGLSIGFAPIISVIWIGHLENLFLFYCVLLGGVYSLNSIAFPAYFANLGLGDVSDNTLSHLLMAFVNCVLGFFLGSMLGLAGVAAAFAAALLSGTIFLLYRFHSRHRIGFKVLCSRYLTKLVPVSIGSAIGPYLFLIVACRFEVDFFDLLIVGLIPLVVYIVFYGSRSNIYRVKSKMLQLIGQRQI